MIEKEPTTEQNSGMTSEEYQKMLGTESYKQLLEADLQAENAKNVALRNTNMALQNAGLQGNAYGGTLANSTANAYLTALQQNMSDFGNNIGQESNKNFETVTAQLSDAGTKDEFMARAKDLGLVDENGNLNYMKSPYLSDTDKQQLQTYYNARLREFGENGTAQQDAESNIYHNEVNPSNTGKGYTNTSTLANGTQISATFDNGSGLNKDLTFKIGSQTYKAEMSNKGKNAGCTGNNGKLLSESELKSLYEKKEVGIPFVHQNKNGVYVILVKDQSGTIRRLERHGARRNDMIEIAKALGLPQGSKVQIANTAGQNAWIGLAGLAGSIGNKATIK